MWLKAQAIQLAQGPIKPTGSRSPSPTWSEKVQRHLPLGGDLREVSRSDFRTRGFKYDFRDFSTELG